MDRHYFRLTEQGQRLLEPGTFKMLRDLWKVVPNDCRADLIYAFIFEPDTLREQWREEMKFKRNMDNAWRG